MAIVTMTEVPGGDAAFAERMRQTEVLDVLRAAPRI
jgi:hypothetical protein